MASSEKELEGQLLEAGNKLVDPPSSVDELLRLLDRVENCLSKVDQSPIQSTQDALSPASKALINDQLFKHPNVDVKVAVASCISEITRITAPDAPYDDDQMKEVFQLIVSSFENLHDMTSRSYAKRTSILETVAKVRSCVVMLDLECDALISEMFKHFLKAIREKHPESVISSMETIMTLVLEESEDIPMELLSPILASIKKDNEGVSPIAQKLGESVIESCANKLKPYLVQAVNTLGISLDDYSNVLASICQEMSGSVEQNDVCATSEHAEDENKSTKDTPEEPAQVDKEGGKEAAPAQQDNLVGDRSPKSVMSNGIVQAGENDALVDSTSLKKQDDTDCSVLAKDISLPVNEKPDDLDTRKAGKSEQKPGKATKRRGRKSSSSAKLPEPSQIPLPAENEGENMTDSKIHSKEVTSSPCEDGRAEAAGPSENNKDIDTQISSPKTVDGGSDVASPAPSGSLLDDNHSKKLGQSKKKDSSAKEVATDDDLKKVSEETSDSEEIKPTRLPVKKVPGRRSDVKKTTVMGSAKKGSGATSDQDAKKHSAKKAEESKKDAVGSSSKLSDDRKRRGQAKVKSEVGVTKSSTKDEEKDMVSSPKSASKSTKDEHVEETPKTTFKRKRTPGKENGSNIKYDETLVGSRVEVWWPDDKTFYKGVVESFDRSKKKHKVSYDDGDQEILNLRKEKWKILNAEAGSDFDGEEGSDHRSPDASAEIPPKKKGKASAGESTKEGKRDALSKSGGATSSKSKGASMKSSQKSKDVSKTDGRSKVHTTKSGGGKSIDAAQKASGKSKIADDSKTSNSIDEDVSPPKTSAKSKQELPKTGKSKQETSKAASASKAKSTKSGGKSNAHDTGKVKSKLLQEKDSETENSVDSTKEIEEDTKGKALSSLKAGSAVAKSGKKRRRN